MNRRIAAGLVFWILAAVGCRSASKSYTLHGQVLEINQTAGEITVKHDEIPGFMPAMTMPYKVKDAAAMSRLQPGDGIVADLVTANQGKDYWLDHVRVTGQSATPTVVQRVLKIGQAVPDLRLVNQDGHAFHFRDFQGKAVLVTFIYTRCPMPTFCPRLTSQFAKIQEDLAKTPADYDRTHLLTISFDPKYDTAPVLRRYGLAYLDNRAEGFAHWDFASTTPADIRQIADAFGLQYVEKDNQITHSIAIVLIAPNGTVARYWNAEWNTPELEDALRQQVRAAQAPVARKKVKG